MSSKRSITINNIDYDATDAAEYHYGGFPPAHIDLTIVMDSLLGAVQQLTRYDERLRTMLNSELLLAPLRRRDAVVSSRMEGTISTLDEVLRLEADQNARRGENPPQHDTIEVLLYARALKQAERQMSEGYGLSEHLIKSAHQTLLSLGRGAEKHPGDYKTQQNYIGDKHQRRIDFIPISPTALPGGMQALIDFVRNSPYQPLIKVAVAHAEFEALHPFEDGNGRLGRMLIPLMLWEYRTLSAPHFFVSDYFERHKDHYIERLRNVSLRQDWSGWCAFFFAAIESQARDNIDVLTRVQALYTEMHERFRQVLRSQHYPAALNYIFANPVFWNNHFVENAEAPPSTLRNFTAKLMAEDILQVLIPASGRAPGLYAFPSLLNIIRDNG